MLAWKRRDYALGLNTGSHAGSTFVTTECHAPAEVREEQFQRMLGG